MQGKIVKGIAGFYYVHVVGFGIYECKAKGSFRKEKRKPLVGDNVEIDCLSEEEKTGNIIFRNLHIMKECANSRDVTIFMSRSVRSRQRWKLERSTKCGIRII